MLDWIHTGAALLIAVLAAWGAIALTRRGRGKSGKPRRPGGLQMLGAVMLGLGEPLDPPSRHVAEAKSDNPRDDETGDPPTT